MTRRAMPGLLAASTAGPLVGGTVLLQADALGGVVEVPADVVTYMALTGLVLACAALPLVLRLGRRRPLHRLTAACAAAAGLAIALAGLIPLVPVFATALLLAGVLAAPLLAVPRAYAARTPGALALHQAAALAGLTAAAWLATLRSATPATALLIAGMAAAVLAAGAAALPGDATAVPGAAAAPDATVPPGATAVPGATVQRGAIVRDDAALLDVVEVPGVPGGSRCGPRARSRDVLREPVVRAALPGYVVAGWVVGVSLMGGLHLLTFRWQLVGEEPVRHLAWALPAAVALVLLGRRAAGTARTAPWLLLAGAAAPVLMATAPRSALLAAGFAVAMAAACLATAALDTAALDTAALRPLPDSRHPAAAGLTAVAAAVGGLAGFGCAAALRGPLAEGSALTLTALPPVVGALLVLRVRGPESAQPPPFLDVRRAGLRMEAGEAVVLAGPGASGLLAALAGLGPCDGEVLLGGADLTVLDAEQRMERGACHLAGPEPLAPGALTVASGLAAHAHALGRADPDTAARAVLDVFPPLRGLGDVPVRALTATQRGLLSLAEALLTRPRLLLVDGIADGPCGAAVHAVLDRLAGTGTAVLIAGPVAPEIRAAAGRVARIPAPDEIRPPPAARNTGGPAR